MSGTQSETKLPMTSVSTPSARDVYISSSASVGSRAEIVAVTTPRVVGRKGKTTDKTLENAVYTYLQSLKTVGREAVGVEEISNSLGLSISQVREIIGRLKNRGAKLE